MSQSAAIHPALARAISAKGYETLTPVQEAILAPELTGEDMIVSAQTGSGKTVAFGLAMASDLLGADETFGKAASPLALAIAPTRELAMQVKSELAWLYAPAGVQIASCVGGMDQREEKNALWRGAHIVVGTPGRLSDHIRRGALDLEKLKAVVLDEADEMLNLGFREELEFILEASPAERRTLMFSATMPKAIEALARKYQRNAKRVITAGERQQHRDIEYRALVTAGHETDNAIFNVLRYYDAPNALVFCQTRAAVTRMMSRFANRGFPAVSLSGELSQSQRTHALQALRDRRAQVCIATDVAARGLDLPDLELVIHADLPKNPEALLHRSGRTGRAGRKGTSVLIVPHRARRGAQRLLQSANINAQWAEPPSAEDIRRKDDERLMSDPILYEPIEESERAFAQTLLGAYEPAQIAAAFVRLHRKGKSAGEELTLEGGAPDSMEGPPPAQGARGANPLRRERIVNDGPRKPPRSRFENAVWISVGVGRMQYAEPRWLIPVLCEAGDITKKSIGAIRVEDADTFVELDPADADAFLSAVESKGPLERSLVVKRLEGEPAVTASTMPEAPQRAERYPKQDRPPRADRPQRDDRPPRAERAPRPERPARSERPERSVSPAGETPRFEKPRFEKPKFEKRERPERTERPERAERKTAWHPDAKAEKPAHAPAEAAQDGQVENRKQRRARLYGHAAGEQAATEPRAEPRTEAARSEAPRPAKSFEKRPPKPYANKAGDKKPRKPFVKKAAGDGPRPAGKGKWRTER